MSIRFNKGKTNIIEISQPQSRDVKIIPIEEVNIINVAINLDNPNCNESVDFLDSEARKVNALVHYLLINQAKTPIPSWCLRKNMTVLNNKIDFSADSFLSTKVKSFIDEKCELYLSVSNEYCPIIEKIASLSNASFKIGREFTKDNPYDLSLKYNEWERNDELAYEYIANLYILTH